ncbi:MAG: hypothetical protein H6710_01190 [Myxococcales bacterium]|nr:hypothetical protein [Myxococcales bacterium]
MIRDLAEETGAAIAALAERSGWPLIADVLAPCRAAGIQRGDAIARRADPGERADAILWFGDAPVSAALLRWIGGSTGPVIQVLEGGEWRDPSFRVSDVVAGDPAAVAAALSLPPADEAWRRALARGRGGRRRGPRRRRRGRPLGGADHRPGDADMAWTTCPCGQLDGDPRRRRLRRACAPARGSSATAGSTGSTAPWRAPPARPRPSAARSWRSSATSRSPTTSAR